MCILVYFLEKHYLQVIHQLLVVFLERKEVDLVWGYGLKFLLFFLYTFVLLGYSTIIYYSNSLRS